MSFLGQDEQIREYQFRFRYLYIGLFVAFFVLFARLWYLQIMNGDKYHTYSEENRIKGVKVTSPRGMIFDRNKHLLVDNRPAFDLEVTPQELYSDKEWKKTIHTIAQIIKMPEEEILDTLERSKGQPTFRPIKIKQDLEQDEVAKIEAHKLDLPGLNIQMEIRRTNLFGDLAAHLMGYIGEVNQTELPKLNRLVGATGVPYKMGDVTGKFGLESRMENVLRGIDGEEYMEVDALGHRKRTNKGITSGLKPKDPTPGKNLILTIDQDLQMAAQRSLEKLYGKKQIGAVIALNPKTGEILAALSQPSFDPTLFSRGVSPKLWGELLNNEYHPLRDKTLQDHYSPGSTFKTITAIAALEEKVIDENTTINCTGSFRLGNRVYHCWNKHGHGVVNIHKAIRESCDVFFYRMGQRLGIDTIAKYANMLGLGRKTGVNLAHEEMGLIPTEEWKKKRFGQEWIAGETLSCAIGQSYILTTPLQLANAYAAIGNGGLLWRPYIVKYIEDNDGRILKEFQPDLIGQAKISKQTIDIVRSGLTAVVNEPGGTTFSRRIPGIDVAGKTGSTQVIRLSADKIHTKCESMPFNVRDNGLFAAFAPPDDPVIAVAVIAEHSCHGGSGAAPVALEVIQTYLQKYMPEKYSDEAIKTRLKIASGKPIRVKAKPEPDEDEDAVRDTEIPDVVAKPAPPAAPGDTD
ncbi:MAG: penicillin-binding protein 2 [Deltaproteobacteria bacterium]|nr:penicillin-binding protein 2 [Deltaproteobacteria bacterium]